MEGPTPVSALIHAATMVTAGVFLVIRCSPIFEYSPKTLTFITIIGALTAFVAATIAVTQNDLKKIIAYSTCSQLGYMFFACGLSNYYSSIFHLFNHGFFKALLFLSAGSVIHAMSDEQDLRKLGGLLNIMPITYICMFIGSLALTGFPFLSGFYSKDAIIEFAYLRGNTTGYYAAGIGIITAFLTSIYSWRLIFKTFHGDYNNKDIKIEETHESPLVMLIPLIFLSIGAIFAGYTFKELFLGYGGINNFWQESIFFLEPLSTNHPPFWFLVLTPILVILSIPVAYYLFVKNKNLSDQIANVNKPLYQFLINKWYFDELYDVLFVVPSKKIGLFLWKIFDIKIIDGFGPDGISSFIKKCSLKANKFQSGFIYQYAFVMLLGFSALLTFLIVK
jgi:NADH-quinone oxidoreductase subunit L